MVGLIHRISIISFCISYCRRIAFSDLFPRSKFLHPEELSVFVIVTMFSLFMVLGMCDCHF